MAASCMWNGHAQYETHLQVLQEVVCAHVLRAGAGRVLLVHLQAAQLPAHGVDMAPVGVACISRPDTDLACAKQLTPCTSQPSRLVLKQTKAAAREAVPGLSYTMRICPLNSPQHASQSLSSESEVSR